MTEKELYWAKRYLGIAKEVSTWSKDPSTKVGAVAVGSKGQILSQGFNGFARGIKDTTERLNNREMKYSLMVHAEMNTIYNATYNGVSLDGASLYVYGLPVCSECAKGIIQVGIRSVYMNIESEWPEKWKDSWEFTKTVFTECGVKFYLI